MAGIGNEEEIGFHVVDQMDCYDAMELDVVELEVGVEKALLVSYEYHEVL